MVGPCAKLGAFTHRPIAYPQLRRDLSQAQALGLQFENLFVAHGAFRAAKLSPARPFIPNPRTHALTDQISLKLSDGRYDCEQHLPQRAAGIDVLLVADELDAERPKFLQRQKTVFGGASKPIKAPHNNCIELTLAGVVQESVKFRA